jgi:GNAT superfamily N-acetyltransferase
VTSTGLLRGFEATEQAASPWAAGPSLASGRGVVQDGDRGEVLMMAHEDPACLREYRPSDLDPVRRLIHGTIDACYPPAYPPEAVSFFKEYHSDEAIEERAEHGHTVVLEWHGRIVGTGTLVKDYVTAVFVERSCQREGFGRRIMAHLEANARSAGVSALTLDASLPSKHFYDSLGYSTVEEGARPVANGKSLRFYRMRKPLE